jgi:cell division protein FtsW
MTHNTENRSDRSLILVTLLLMGIGLVQVYSASFIYATEVFNNGHYFFIRQMGFSVGALVVLLGLMRIPYSYIEKWGYLLWVLGCVGVAATFVPGLGVRVGGGLRWLQFPLGLRFEPSELLKIGYPLILAKFFADRQNANWKGWGWRAIALILPLVLLMKQPDFGSFFICVFTLFCMFFVFGLNWAFVISGAVVAVPAFYFFVYQVPYRWARVLTFLDPWADPTRKGFQVIQSMISFHSGGWTGVGLGQGQGKLFFLPEAHTDFTLAILGEEMGFTGLFILFCLYGFVVLRAFQIAARCKDTYAQAAAMGISIVLGVSIFINSGVAMGLLPTKGLTLPLISYGGSSLLASCLALGLLLNIDRAQNLKQKRMSNFYKI